MKPPVGAITEKNDLLKLVAKARIKPIKVFLVWFTDKKWTITIIEFNEFSQVRDGAIYDVVISNYQPSRSCSLSPITKDVNFVEKYWYFRNYWLAYGYLCQMKTKSPDSY